MEPKDALCSTLGKKVTVIFKNGVEQDGILKSFDDYINIILETDEPKELIIKGSKISLIVLQSEVLYTRTSEN
jgi:small nuclear ribonucleoprotein (snRNP)-like protein